MNKVINIVSQWLIKWPIHPRESINQDMPRQWLNSQWRCLYHRT